MNISNNEITPFVHRRGFPAAQNSRPNPAEAMHQGADTRTARFFTGTPPHRLGGRMAGVLVILSAMLMLTLSSSARASQAWGSINNFDVVNDTGVVCHGFEIEIDGAHSKDITYTYDWNHYGVPIISEDNTDPLNPKAFVRYASAKNPDGTWAAFTAIPSGPISPTQGHQFTNPSVNFGGEHFGVGYYGTPAAVKYSWLKDDGAGNLVYAGSVSISTPTFTYNPPVVAQPAQVVAAIVPPPPPAPPVLEFGTASWVKETRTSAHNNHPVPLRALVSPDPNDPNADNWTNNEPAEVEVEWQIFQTDFGAGNGGANGEMEGAPEDLQNGDEVITRRYDFFKYVGPTDPETGEALADSVDPDGIHGTGIYSNVVVVGDYIGAQMAGFDAAAKIGLIDHLQDGTMNVPYPERTIVVGGTPPINTTITGQPPKGMNFDVVSGILSGTPTVSGKFTFTIHSTDANGGDVTATYNLTIAPSGVVPPAHSTVTTTASPSTGGKTTGDGDYNNGTNVTVVATSNPGFTFVNWTEAGALVSASSSYQFTVTVNRALVANFARFTRMTLDPAKAQVGNKATLVATLYDKSARTPYPGQSVQFALNGTNIGQPVVTNAKGRALYSFIVPDNTPLGQNTITVTFSGDTNNLPATATSTLAVTQGIVNLTLTGVSGHAGGSVTLTAKLTDASKTPISGASIAFTVGGSAAGPATTDATGTATLSYPIPSGTAPGYYAIVATFSGDSNHLASMKVGWLLVK